MAASSSGSSISVGQPCVRKPRCLTDYLRARAEGFSGPTRICFFAMATDRRGVALVQTSRDPRPGYFISTTAFQQPGSMAGIPQAQLDSNVIPYIVIPGSWWRRDRFRRLELGDFAVVFRPVTGRVAYAVIGDAGPSRALGEGSVALHAALGNDPFVLRAGKRRAARGIGERDVLYVLFPGSRRENTLVTPELVAVEGKRLLEQFGGDDRLRACSASVSRAGSPNR
jgi:glycosyl hydrolase group 75 (putative chitosanase)